MLTQANRSSSGDGWAALPLKLLIAFVSANKVRVTVSFPARTNASHSLASGHHRR